MARRYFGTDGIRGRANTDPMTAEMALSVAMAAGAHFTSDHRRHKVVIGKDTRLSSYMLEPALTAGFTAVGMDVLLAGVLPTPAVASLTATMRADLGVMISASHNPFQDNGIKLFGPDGYKLSDQIETEIEDRMDSFAHGRAQEVRVDSADLGKVERVESVFGRYLEATKRCFPQDLTLKGLKIGLDCANGAAYRIAPTVLYELGADVVAMGTEPNGTNINDNCGATHVEALQKLVVENGCDIGLALDGDADRLIIVDERGTKVDGDQIMAAIAESLANTGGLAGNTLVATVMSNLGMERHLAGLGIRTERTQVGDRYVLAKMRQHGYSLGGEQSGHLILAEHATTGDGLAAALQVLALMRRENRPASTLLTRFEPLPQLLKNARYAAGNQPLELGEVQAAIADAEAQLEGCGRLLIRKSGTEPLIRVMAEGEDAVAVERIVTDLRDLIEKVGA